MDGLRRQRCCSTLAIVMAIAPIAGPLFAGHLLVWYTWHAIFWLLVIIGVFMLLAVLLLPETLQGKA